MRASNSLTNAGSQGEKFSTAIMGSALQSMIRAATPDAKSAARLTGTLISMVAENDSLKACSSASIVAAALRGEGAGLICGQGYYVIPYGNLAKYQISYKGLAQLAIATGEIADIDCIEVREGELVGMDSRKKRPVFDFSKYPTEEEALQHPVIGYYAFVEKKDGYFRGEYWGVQKLLSHAERYAKAFNMDKYRKLVSGELSPGETETLKSGSPWYDVGGGQVTMMQKTVLKSLLNSGYIVLANDVGLSNALEEDSDAEPEDLSGLLDIGPGKKPKAAADTAPVAATVDATAVQDSKPAREAVQSPSGAETTDKGNYTAKAQKPADGEATGRGAAKRGKPEQTTDEDENWQSLFGTER